MDNNKRKLFKYFDIIFVDYELVTKQRSYAGWEQGISYQFRNGTELAFNYDTEVNVVKFNYDDFFDAKSILGIGPGELIDLCREYINTKLDEPLKKTTRLLVTQF
jgi:hypothetical protein